MPRYAVKFSLTNGKSSVHTVSCTQARLRRGFVITEMEAQNAGFAAARFEFSERLTTRGFPFPAICACARSMDALRAQNARRGGR